jgi:hypothetical protein
MYSLYSIIWIGKRQNFLFRRRNCLIRLRWSQLYAHKKYICLLEKHCASLKQLYYLIVIRDVQFAGAIVYINIYTYIYISYINVRSGRCCKHGRMRCENERQMSSLGGQPSLSLSPHHCTFSCTVRSRGANYLGCAIPEKEEIFENTVHFLYESNPTLRKFPNNLWKLCLISSDYWETALKGNGSHILYILKIYLFFIGQCRAYLQLNLYDIVCFVYLKAH